MRALHWLGLLGTLALAGRPAPAGAQAVGSEFQINTYTTSNQQTRSFGSAGSLVAADASGNFVVVWQSLGQDGSGDGIFGQRYDHAGNKLGKEFRVNSYSPSNQVAPSVASDTSGNFVVVWDSYAQDGSFNGIFGQRYDSAGSKLGSEFRVNSYTTNTQRYGSVASDASGNFVVVWESYRQNGSYQDIFGQRYDSGGGALGAEFHVNTTSHYYQRFPSVASDASGNFVVVWGAFQQGVDNDYGIFGQRYDSAGAALGTEFRINTYIPGRQNFPSVSSDANGNFVVVWESYAQDGSYDGIFGQRYDSGGGPLGDEFQVNSFTVGGQRWPSVASDANGNFLVAWQRFDGSGVGVFGQRYDSAGVAQGGEFQVNTFTTLSQQYPSVGTTGTNEFVVAWESIGQDGSGVGVFGQRFDFAETITVLSPNTNVNWKIGSLQKIQWKHNLGAGASFRIELDRTDDGTYEELVAAHAHASNATKGSFTWTVTGPPSGTARIRVSLTNDPSVSDTSDTTFQITSPIDALGQLGRLPDTQHSQ